MDEHALVLAETDRDGAEQVLGRFRAALAAAMERGGWSVTASIGALVLTRAPPSLDVVLAEVDALMYRSKREGKDRLVLATDAVEG